MPNAWLVRRKAGPRSLLEDGQFRMRALGLASTGISRRGAAMRLGIEPATLGDYLARGKAQPDVEPWGSFAAEYLEAERGLEEAAATTIGLWVAHKRAIAEVSPEKLDSSDVRTLERILEKRYPQDRGTSAHRLPEADPNGAAWLERHALTQEQLVELFRKPPEPVLEALVAAADDVFALLLASGWAPQGSSGIPSPSKSTASDDELAR